MNIFVLDRDIKKNVQYHNDKHVVKMCLEYAQLLSTVSNLSGIETEYKATHIKHPCVLWLQKSLSHWLWLKDLALALGEEYTFRYDKKHKSIEKVVKNLPQAKIADKGWLEDPPQAMPEKYRNKDVVKAYQQYYQGEKASFSKWKKRPIPEFMRKIIKD